LINLDPVISQDWLENHCGGIPVITHNRLDGLSPAIMDHAAGMRMAYEHLVALGHRRIGHLAGPRSDLGAMSRINGFLSCALSMPHATPAEPVIYGDWTMESGEAAARKVVDAGFTAIVCSNDLMAIGLMRGLRQLGKRVPDDCSIVGFDNTLLSQAGDPPMTTLVQALDEIALRTVEALMAKIEDKEELPVEAYAPRLIVRQSTKAIVTID
jgi:DNA-binding LacI/PurR family transcriptional regulator